jgi:hypothetical protein
MSLTAIAPDGKEYTVSPPPGKEVSDWKVREACDALRQAASVPADSPLSLRRGEGTVSPYALVSSLGLKPDEKLTIALEPARVGSRDLGKRTLPRRTDIDMSEIRDPPDIDDLVQRVLALGLGSITEEDALEALRSGMFNVDRACEYLLALDGQATPLAAPKLKLTPAELADCREIERETGETIEQVIQFYVICDKDGARTRHLISHGTG